MAAASRLVATLVRRIRRKGHEVSALFVGAVILAACAGAGTTHALWCRRAEAHHWRLVRLEAARVDVLYHDCDHLARHNRRLTDEQAELREGVGDLLDTVQHYETVIANTRRRTPVPAYGTHRLGARIP